MNEGEFKFEKVPDDAVTFLTDLFAFFFMPFFLFHAALVSLMQVLFISVNEPVKREVLSNGMVR